MKKLALIIWTNLIMILMNPISVMAQTNKKSLNDLQLEILFEDTARTPELQSLPGGTQNVDILTNSIPGLIKFSLQLAGVIALALAVYAGVLMVVGRGEEESLKKGKEILLYAVVAVVIISSAFALVSGIVSFKF